MKTNKDIRNALQDALKQFPEIKIITLFGSAATNRLMSDSDLDIAVSADAPLSFDQKYEIMKALYDAFPREIDLIDLQAVAGPILQEALCTGFIVKKDSASLFYQLIKKMWLNQADMMPLTRMIIIDRCKRFVQNEH
jgi:predicted nucleotidyltransferase